MFSFLSRVVKFIAIGIETEASGGWGVGERWECLVNTVQLGKTGSSRDGR